MDDSVETRALVCQEALLVADADAGVLYLAEPGRLVAAGGAGRQLAGARVREISPVVERAVRQGTLECDDSTLVVPVLGDAVVLGAVELHGAPHPETSTRDALQVFAHLAGSVFERFGEVVEEGDLDPVTGVGDHRRAAAALASVRPGDGVVVCELDGIGELRQRGPAAADLAQGQLGLQLRTAVRPGDVVARFGDDGFLLVLRQLRAPIEVVVQRVLGERRVSSAGITISAGAALHLEPAAPADTADSAARMMTSARASGVGQFHIAPMSR
jgi:GGDEF domain-containing protein